MVFKVPYSLVFLFTMLFASCGKNEIINGEEEAWLKLHPGLVVGVSPNAPPYQFVSEKGDVNGIFIDFLSIIEAQIDYKFVKFYESDFSRLLEDCKDRKVDVLLEVQKTEERERFLNFTPALLSHPHVIVIRKSQIGISSPEDLEGKTVSVVNLYAIQEYLKKYYPDLKLRPDFDDVACLRSVAIGQTDAFICQQAVATYYIEKEGISNLKISGEVNYSNQLAIASIKSLDTLNIILSKAVNSISKSEKLRIYNNWLSYTIKPFYLETKFWFATLIIFLLLLAVVILFNIALRKRVREKTIELVMAKEHAEESDRLKSAFLTNLNHEIRTPMNGILGFAELLKEPDLSGEKQKGYIQFIKQCSDRMLNTISNIVEISKIESGQIEVYSRESNINLLIEDVFNFFKPLAESKSIRLSFSNGLPENEAHVIIDTEKFHAILSNLVKNAITFTDSGSVEFGYEKMDPTVTSFAIRFFVKDTGIGIPKDRQKAIFERFIKADMSNKRAFQGSGLGLAITKSYIDLMGGTIWLESIEGTGTIIYFTIPFSISSKGIDNSRNATNYEISEKPFKKLKIVIAEDDETSGLYLSVILGELTGEIVVVETGTAVVQVCRNNPDIDLVLMDIRMPDMDGYEATRQIRTFNNTVIIIAQTAHGLSGDCEMALNAGCNDYISKPIDKAHLFSLISKHFKK